ncbi:MAG: acyltransferase [Dehalococcoidales bacterium]|nr:acyltransferase [Dehalococcoidales bacterium]
MTRHHKNKWNSTKRLKKSSIVPEKTGLVEEPGSGRRSVLIDIVRAIAIILILIAHIAQTIGSPLGGFFGLRGFYFVSIGGVGVTLFFILSGCSLQVTYGSQTLNYIKFVFKRLIRIYPVYWMVLIIGILAYLSSNHFSVETVAGKLHYYDIVLSLGGLYAFTGKWGGLFVNTSWFIGVIVVLYLVFPLISACIKRYPIISLISLLAISFISRWVLYREILSLPNRPTDWFPPCRVFEFGLGIYLATVISKSFLFTSGLNTRTLNKALFTIAELSFPLFLVHYPLLRMINWLTGSGLNVCLAIFIFLGCSIILSWILLNVDRHLQQKFSVSLRHHKMGLHPSA